MGNPAWAKLQVDVVDWARSNFSDNTPELLMCGVIEEIAEFYDPTEPHSREKLMDALGDQCIYVLNLCDMVLVSFADDVDIEMNVPMYMSERELIGAMGLACRAILKYHQGIRGIGIEERKFHCKLAVGLWYRWAQMQCNNYALGPLLPIVQDVWSRVQQRDWKKNPTDAHQKLNGGTEYGKEYDGTDYG